MSEPRPPVANDDRVADGDTRPPGFRADAGPADEVAAQLAFLAMKAAGADAVLLTEEGPEPGGERLLAWAGLRHPEPMAWRLPDGDPVRDRVYASAEAWVTSGLGALEGGGLPRTGARAVAALPLPAEGGRVLGCLRLLSAEPRTWGAEELSRVSALCAVGGGLLALRRDLRAARRELVAMDSIVDGFLTVDREWRVLEVSPGLEMMLGRAGTELRGRPLWEDFPDSEESPFGSHCRRAASRRAPSEFEVYAPPFGRWMEVFVLPAPEHLTFYFRDIAERKAEEERSLRTAHRDPLTGLATRAQLVEWLSRALGRANRRTDFAFALLFLDLDRLKIINDTLGHLAGDAVLRTVARRLEESVRPGDSVARFGGDEFAVLLYNVQGLDDATRITGRIQRTLRAPILVEGREIRTTASVGIALSTSGYAEGDEMLHHADLALYRAKLLGRERYEVFDDAMRENAAALQRMKRELHEAIGAGQLRLDLEPTVPLAGGDPAWLEARLAWSHPRRGRLDAAEFVSVAEDSSLILEVGGWMLRTTCALLAERGKEEPPLALRLSARHLLSPDLLEDVAGALSEAGVSGDRLLISIPAKVLVEHPETAVDVAAGLERLGIPLLLHDFGRGLVSLARLAQLSVSAVVLDVTGRGDHSDGLDPDRELPLVVALGRSLGMRVAAAGLGSAEGLERVRGLGVELGAGPAVAARLQVEEAPGSPSRT